jgi:hypothetical protein
VEVSLRYADNTVMAIGITVVLPALPAVVGWSELLRERRGVFARRRSGCFSSVLMSIQCPRRVVALR